MCLASSGSRRGRTVVGAARWLLPWIGTLAVSSGLALAADNGLEVVLVTPPESTTANAQITAAFHWLRVQSIDSDGSDVVFLCLARPDAVRGDTVELRTHDLRSFTHDACIEGSAVRLEPALNGRP
jgi:hypothetical protein